MTNPHTGSTRLVLTLVKKAIGGYQVHLAALDDKDAGLGRRLLGTKHYNMGATVVLKDELTADDAAEIRAMLDAVYPVEPVDEQPPVDQALRNRIRRAICEFPFDDYGLDDVSYLLDSEPDSQEWVPKLADSVLAALPTTADRGAVLREAADDIEQGGQR
jgi:hypothetical protein